MSHAQVAYFPPKKICSMWVAETATNPVKHKAAPPSPTLTRSALRCIDFVPPRPNSPENAGRKRGPVDITTCIITSDGNCIALRMPAAPRPNMPATRNICVWLEMENSTVLPTSHLPYFQFSPNTVLQEVASSPASLWLNALSRHSNKPAETRLALPMSTNAVNELSQAKWASAKRP